MSTTLARPLDGRTKAAKYLKTERRALTREISKPTASQRALIDTAVQLKLRLANMERDPAGTDHRLYLATSDESAAAAREVLLT